MNGSITQASRFFLERWIQKGVLHQLLLMAALVALVALLGGLVAWLATPAFESPGPAIWWAFLRLTDPGYLGDDEGTLLRVVSTAVTVLGYVLFMGSMIAIMTQWLAQTLRKLESGLTPIRMRDHVLVLGWTNRTPEIVLKLLSARGRLERFLAGRSARKLRVVVLSEEVGVERRLELREHLGAFWSDSQVFLRSGSSLHPDHLVRLDLLRASTVIVPGADFELGGSEASDTRVVKTLLTIDSLLRGGTAGRLPQVVAEVFDPLKAPLARQAVDAPIEVIASDSVISRLISQSIRHRGLAQILHGILSHRQGNSIYLRAHPHLAGLRPRDLHQAFPQAIVLGFVRTEGGQRTPRLEPLDDTPLREDDLLALLAESYEHCGPSPGRHQPLELERRAWVAAAGPSRDAHRVLVLGWSHKVGALAVELDASRSSRFELTVMSRVPAPERERWMQRVAYNEENVVVVQREGDYSIEKQLLALDPGSFDNVIFLASDWLPSSEEADARTILGYVLLRSVLEGVPEPPEILVELLDPDNAHLFEEGRDVQLVTPRLLSYLLAHVALRPELNSVFETLFGAGGAEITLTGAAELKLAGRSASFAEIQRAAVENGLVALGLVTAAGVSELNPERERRYELSEMDEVVVLAPETPGQD